MADRIIEGTSFAWLSDLNAPDIGPAELANMPGDKLLPFINFSSWDMQTQGWTRIGLARIEVTISDPQVVIANKIEALKVQKRNLLADTQNKVTQIEREIQTLLAISFDAQAGQR